MPTSRLPRDGLSGEKDSNAGQTCIAPDYLLVDRVIQEAFVEQFCKELERLYGESTRESDMARIINPNHFQRLVHLLEGTRVLAGGTVRAKDLYISLTLVDPMDWEHPIMQEEIFGPILPMLTYDELDDAVNTTNKHPKPLAFYLFTKNRRLARQTVDASPRVESASTIH